MVMVKATDLVMFFVLILYVAEIVPTQLRAKAIYTLVILELGANLCGLEL